MAYICQQVERGPCTWLWLVSMEVQLIALEAFVCYIPAIIGKQCMWKIVVFDRYAIGK